MVWNRWLALGADHGATFVGTVAVHEAGHCVAAAVFGLRPRITVTAGGARTVYRPGATPRQSVVIALAGPVCQAGFILARAGKKRPGVAVIVAMAALARNVAPVPSSDGEKIWGRQHGSRRLRWIAYWGLSSTAAVASAWTGDTKPALQHLYLYDLYLGRIREWARQTAFRLECKVRGLSM